MFWALKARVEGLVEKKNKAHAKLMAKKEELLQVEQHALDTDVACTTAQAIAQEIQETAHKQIAQIVTRCLQAVFDDPYEFSIQFVQKRGRTEAELVFLRDGNPVSPTSAAGGGVVDVAAFALRLACLVLSKPPARRVLFMDEPFKFVSEEYRHKLCDILHSLSVDMGVQFVMVTHIRELELGTVIRVG